jgi:acetyltransferase
LQAKLLELTDKYGIKVIGPNCIGVVNPWANMNVTYFPYTAKPGQIGMISHSGTYLCHVYSYLGRRECGLAQGMSLGNELNTDITDGIDYLGQSENARSIAMYIEAIRRPRKFIETARRVSAKKPIVAMYVGTSEAGARATSSHTAAMSGSGQILEGVLDQAGVIRARGMQELFDFADALAKLPPLKGTRIAVLTNSGGPGASSAEALERMGLSCPVLSEKTQEKLSAILPHTASARNPVDFTYSADMAAFYVQAPQIILEDPEIDGLIIYGLFGPGFWREMAKNAQEQMLLPDIDAITQMANYFFDALSSMPKKYDKPLVAVNFDGFADDATQEMRMRGVPVLPSPERAVAVMHALHQYHKILNRGQ